jgi:hypothetical protein
MIRLISRSRFDKSQNDYNDITLLGNILLGLFVVSALLISVKTTAITTIIEKNKKVLVLGASKVTNGENNWSRRILVKEIRHSGK